MSTVVHGMEQHAGRRWCGMVWCGSDRHGTHLPTLSLLADQVAVPISRPLSPLTPCLFTYTVLHPCVALLLPRLPYKNTPLALCVSSRSARCTLSAPRSVRWSVCWIVEKVSRTVYAKFRCVFAGTECQHKLSGRGVGLEECA